MMPFLFNKQQTGTYQSHWYSLPPENTVFLLRGRDCEETDKKCVKVTVGLRYLIKAAGYALGFLL